MLFALLSTITSTIMKLKCFTRTSHSTDGHASAALRGCLFALLPLVLIALVAGCQQPGADWAAASNSAIASAGTTQPAASPATVLRESDVIQIAFEAETNLNTVAKIQLDGTVVLPMVGEVHAAGKTLQELQADLQKSYAKFIKTSDLTITLSSSAACVYVSGAVLRPGRIPLDRPMTALEAIMEAGGFNLEKANLSKVSVHRMVNGRQKRFRLNLKSALDKGDTNPFQLQPFDMIFVPEKIWHL